MQSANQPEIPHLLVSAGVDWITATSQHGEARWSMTEYARQERHRLMDSGETIRQAYRLGYTGWEVDGFFHGQREGGTIVIASGAVANRVWRTVSNVSDHISRLDLQATVATPEERPRLGVQAYSAIKGGSPSRVKVKNATIITSHPQGETLCIGKRSSDQYGRLYDKATEAGLGEPRSLWRYEIELKRNPANVAATTLRGSESVEGMASRLVWDWYSARGVTPIYRPCLSFCPQKPMPTNERRDVLDWFEKTLSITVGKAVRRHGLTRTLEALGLLNIVRANYERSDDDAGRS